MAIGARSQPIKTYLEKHVAEFRDCLSCYPLLAEPLSLQALEKTSSGTASRQSAHHNPMKSSTLPTAQLALSALTSPSPFTRVTTCVHWSALGSHTPLAKVIGKDRSYVNSPSAISFLFSLQLELVRPPAAAVPAPALAGGEGPAPSGPAQDAAGATAAPPPPPATGDAAAAMQVERR